MVHRCRHPCGNERLHTRVDAWPGSATRFARPGIGQLQRTSGGNDARVPETRPGVPGLPFCFSLAARSALLATSLGIGNSGGRWSDSLYVIVGAVFSQVSSNPPVVCR